MKLISNTDHMRIAGRIKPIFGQIQKKRKKKGTTTSTVKEKEELESSLDVYLTRLKITVTL